MNSKEYQKTIDILTPLLTIGTKFRYMKLHDNYLYHVRSVVDNNIVVVKYYGKHKQWWHYEIQSMYKIWLAYKDDCLKFVK